MRIFKLKDTDETLHTDRMTSFVPVHGQIVHIEQKQYVVVSTHILSDLNELLIYVIPAVIPPPLTPR